MKNQRTNEGGVLAGLLAALLSFAVIVLCFGCSSLKEAQDQLVLRGQAEGTVYVATNFDDMIAIVDGQAGLGVWALSTLGEWRLHKPLVEGERFIEVRDGTRGLRYKGDIGAPLPEWTRVIIERYMSPMDIRFWAITYEPPLSEIES